MTDPGPGVFGGPTRETIPDRCPACGVAWPSNGRGGVRAGHVQRSWEPCHGCTGARHGGHRTLICATCGVEWFDAACDRLGGGRSVQRLTR